MEILIGVAGWDYPDWKDTVYGNLPRAQHLPFLAQFLDLVEVNVTFYRLPEPTTVSGWLRKVRPTRLRFVLKLFRGFTHEPDLLTDDSLPAFRQLSELVASEDRLAGILAQFPSRFRPTAPALELLAALRVQLEPFPLFLEIRHPSWEKSEILSYLHELGYHLVTLDYPFTPHPETPNLFNFRGQVYLRFHGRNRSTWFSPDATRETRYDYLYSPDELRPWLEQLKQHAAQIQRALLVFNNHPRGQAVANALQARALAAGRPVEIPSSPLAQHPALQGFVRVRERDAGPLFR